MKDVKDVEEDLAEFELKRLRELQMEVLELTYEDAWGHHLRYAACLHINPREANKPQSSP
jgi:hypothetical protein